MRIIRAYFRDTDKEKSNPVDLGIFIESKFDYGKAYARAYQIVAHNNMGVLPNGVIEIAPINK